MSILIWPPSIACRLKRLRGKTQSRCQPKLLIHGLPIQSSEGSQLLLYNKLKQNFPFCHNDKLETRTLTAFLGFDVARVIVAPAIAKQ